MAIKPFVKGATIDKQPAQGRIKPFVPVKRAIQPKQDVRQSQNYLKAQETAKRYSQEAKKAASFRGMYSSFMKGLPQATAEVLVREPLKFIASTAEVPETFIRGGKTSQREYKVPGLTPFKSYQSDFEKTAGDVIEGKKGLGSAAWGLARPVLGALETAGIGKGLGRASTALKSGQLKTAGLDVLDAFVPTTRSVKGSSKEGIRKIEGKPKRQSLDIGKVKSKLEKVDVPYEPTLTQKSGKVKPLQEGGKTRGFIRSVKESEELSEDLRARATGEYDVLRNKPLQEKAQRTIFDNPNEAERIARENIGAEGEIQATELIKHYDKIAAKAKASGDMETFNQALDKAVDLTKNNAQNLTESGRHIQAAKSINKLSPEGMLKYINKIAKQTGSDFKLSNEKTFDFMRKAEEVNSILDPRQKAFATFDLIDELTDTLPRGKKDMFFEVLNLPRAMMATADLSAPLRQGIFSAVKHPKIFGRAFKEMFKYAFSEKALKGLKADIITSPNYSLYKKYKLPLTELDAGLSGREEAFMSQLAEKIPGFGRIARGSNRAYTGFLNKMRTDLYDDMIKTAKLENITDPKFFEDAANFVGSATGRGGLGRFEDAAKILNTGFFSPRLAASRISLINPVNYAKMHPAVRKEALKTLATFVGTGSSVLAIAKMNGAEVGDNPRSADFGKIKIGNTRYDIWGGFQQYARLIGQLTTGEKVSTITGRQTTLGEGYNAPTRESIIGDFIKSKEAPLVSFANRALQGERYGEEFNLPAEVIDRFIPMVASDAFDLVREQGWVKGLGMVIPAPFGVGLQTYGEQVPSLEETPSGSPTIKYRSQPDLGETILNKLTGKQISNIPEELRSGLAEERLEDQKRKAQVDAGKQMTLITGEPRQVGDTKIYLENGVVKTKKTSGEKRLPKKDELIKQAIEERKTNPFYQ